MRAAQAGPNVEEVIWVWRQNNALPGCRAHVPDYGQAQDPARPSDMDPQRPPSR